MVGTSLDSGGTNIFVIEKSKAPKLSLKVGGKAKAKIHAMYPFLGGGTYQRPVLCTHFWGWYLPATHAIYFIFAGEVTARGCW